ncbi:protein LYK2-like [Neltuma alba]|uniref:protein LYK2-like n=1 Tax=Neltuma alba TaxID=207710 RepID=UPI0010A549B0|nr:protein LYK2-like [Prosopis alba]
MTVPCMFKGEHTKLNHILVLTPHKKSNMWNTELWVGLAGGIVGIFIAFGAVVLVIRLKNKKEKKGIGKGGDLELQHLNLSVRTTCDKKVSFEGSPDIVKGKIIDTTPRKMLLETYTIEELRKATEDFNSTNQIEGPVFHGRLNGKSMAIKRTNSDTLTKIDFGLFNEALHHHPNILKLIGRCSTEGPESYLVFEFAENGSLRDWLHGGLAIKNQFISSCYCFLSWSQRLRICLDVAMGLQYMHHVMNPSYVHRNVKSRNIFLDEDFGAKVGNFGMAGCVENETEDPLSYSTNPASWSLGYLAPEYVRQGTISPSIDIFAYGVVLLEMLSGQTPISKHNMKGEGSIWLTEKIKSLFKSENVDELREWMDSTLGENYSFDAAITVAKLARACVEEDPSLRPSAGEVVGKLSKLVEELPEEEHLFSESSTKPLVKAPLNNQ